MQRNKSSSQTGSSFSKPLSINANINLDKMQKLNSIVQQIQETNRQSELNDKKASLPPSQPRQLRSGMSEKVLDYIKNRIKTNYDQLYTNYDQNKNKILKQIQSVETNITAENAMSNKFDEVLKEKSKYDKLKAEVEDKQRKLKKLMDNRDQIKMQVGDYGPDSNLNQNYQKLQTLENRKKDLEYQSAILQNMLAQRKKIKLNLKEKYTKMQQEIASKKERAKKIENANFTKKNLLNKIDQDLQKDDALQIPQKLAQQLSNKLQEYENKHSYNNIIHHEAILSQARYNQQKQDSLRLKEEVKGAKSKRQSEQKAEFQQHHNNYLIKYYEEQKIKKLCGVRNLHQITDGYLETDKQNLNQISQQIQSEIEESQRQNELLQKEIQDLLKLGQTQSQLENIYEIEKKCEQQEKQLKRIMSHYDKSTAQVNEWLTIAQILMKDQTKHGLNGVIQEAERNFIKKQCSTQPNSNQSNRSSKFTKINRMQEQD